MWVAVQIGFQVLLYVAVFTAGVAYCEQKWRRRKVTVAAALGPDVQIEGQPASAELRVLLYEQDNTPLAAGVVFINAAVERKREYTNAAIGVLERALNETDPDER